MLILGRKLNEEIQIGDHITIKVCRFGLGMVRLGIKAPPDMRVDRKELRDQIEAEREREGKL